jgi:hypothetical protein
MLYLPYPLDPYPEVTESEFENNAVIPPMLKNATKEARV